MAVERTIHVGFHSNFGVFKRNRHSKTVTRLAITNGFPFNQPTGVVQSSYYVKITFCIVNPVIVFTVSRCYLFVCERRLG